MARTHYLPKWVLREFRQQKPFQLDIRSGRIIQIGLDKAGADEDLWPQDIENGVMSSDSPAARVFQQSIKGQDRIRLTKDEKFIFASWLALFMLRNPATGKAIKELTDNINHNPDTMIPFLFDPNDNLSIRKGVLATIERTTPDLYRDTISEYGQEQGEMLLLFNIAKLTHDGKINWTVKPELVRDTHLRTTDLGCFASILCRYRWTFYRTDRWFVIGDNPLVRWHTASNRCNYGIRRKGVEITMPLALSLMLRMSKGPTRRDDDQVRHIGSQMRRIYNRRQRVAALRYIYAAEDDHLRGLISLNGSTHKG